jgi:hypothetical protein
MSEIDRTYLWILGAPDPEMEAIERLLIQAGQKVAYATVAGQRVTPDSAYQADGTTCEYELAEESLPVFVECEVHGIKPWLVVDHHRPGDPGYRVPPEEFLMGASIGQVIAALARMDAIPANVTWVSPDPIVTSPGQSPAGRFAFVYHMWVVSTNPRHGITPWHKVYPEVLFIAASDHCLMAAYQGRCPGVNPDALMCWRAGARARYQGRPVRAVLKDIARARKALAKAPRVLIGGVPVADLRGQQIPELPEAAAREGIPFLGTPKTKPGARRKVVLQCAPPEVLADWPEWAARNGITDLYGGDPERGFAGGYLD